MKVWFNLFCADPEAQLGFYAGLLGWPEAVASRSAIYRAVEQDGVQIGFNAPAAYALLGLADRRPPGLPAPVTAYATFMLATPGAVDAAADFAARHGGQRGQAALPHLLRPMAGRAGRPRGPCVPRQLRRAARRRGAGNPAGLMRFRGRAGGHGVRPRPSHPSRKPRGP